MSLYVGTEKVAPIIRIFEEGGEPVNINNQAKTVTPTKSEQTIKHDDGYTGLGTVTVNPIPDDYIIPTGNISITENGTAINVHDYDNATVNVQPSLQEKLVTLSRDSQDITSDSGYYGLSRVSVPGIPSEYIVPSGAKTITTNGTVNVTEFAEAKVNVQPALQDKTATPTKSAQQIKADTTYYGLGTVTVAPIPDNYVVPTGNVSITSNGTHNVSGKVNAVVNVKPALEAKTVSPMTTSQVITPSSADYYGLSKVTVNAVDSTIDSNIKASNIVKGVSILGVEGGYTPSTESKSVSLDFSSGSTINVTPTNESTYLTSVSISKPLELVPANIANGTTIAGITGTYVTPISTESKTITDISFASGNYKVTPSAGKYLESVTVNRPSTLEAGNIKSGVSIAGVEGTYTGTFSGTKELTNLTTYDVSGFKYAKVVDSNLIPDNIRKGTKILGLTGTYQGPDYTLQSKTVLADFSAGSMNITPDSGYDYLSNVTVSQPSSLVAPNIKEGVSVAGITGTYKGTFAGTAIITDTKKVDVSGKQYAQVVDNNLTAANIKEGVSILGVTGTGVPSYSRVYFNTKKGLTTEEGYQPTQGDGWIYDFLATTVVDGKTYIISSLQMEGYSETVDGDTTCSVQDDVITISNENKYIKYIELRVNTPRVTTAKPGYIGHTNNIYYNKTRLGNISSIEILNTPDEYEKFKITTVEPNTEFYGSDKHEIELKTGEMVNTPNAGSVYRIIAGRFGDANFPTGIYKFKISCIDTATRITDINVNVNV